MTNVGVYRMAERGIAPAGAPRPGAGSVIASCSWLASATGVNANATALQAIKPKTAMFVGDHRLRRLWEPSR